MKFEWQKGKSFFQAVFYTGLPMFLLLLGLIALEPLVGLPFPATMAWLTAGQFAFWLWARERATHGELGGQTPARASLPDAFADGSFVATEAGQSAKREGALLFVFSEAARQQQRAAEAQRR